MTNTYKSELQTTGGDFIPTYVNAGGDNTATLTDSDGWSFTGIFYGANFLAAAAPIPYAADPLATAAAVAAEVESILTQALGDGSTASVSLQGKAGTGDGAFYNAVIELYRPDANSEFFSVPQNVVLLFEKTSTAPQYIFCPLVNSSVEKLGLLPAPTSSYNQSQRPPLGL